jgi:hypothetical protein
MTYYLIVSLAVGTAIANIFVYKFARKTIFLAGFAFIFLLLVWAAAFIELKMGKETLACLCLLQFTQQLINAPLYAYQTEVLVD